MTPSSPMSVPLLEIDDVRVWFPIQRGVLARTVGHVRAVDGVSLAVAPGETLGLVGESGCGKTTLARAILRLEPTRSGRIVFDGKNLSELAPETLRRTRRDLQVIFQDPFASLNPRMTVMDIITEGPLLHGLIASHERTIEALRLLADVGLGTDALHRYPHEFSGGQRQRISVARAVSLRPKLIICDEPVSALDVSVRAQVLNLLMDMRDKYGLSYLFISHDLSVVRQIADRTAVMYLGQIVEMGRTETILTEPAHPYTRALISAIPRAGVPRRERIVLSGDVPCPHAIDRCRQTIPTLAPAGENHHVACLRYGEI